jgi:hypothetical protein
VTGISLVSWLWRPVGRARDIGWGDIALAGFLSVWAAGLVSGVFKTGHPTGGVVAAIAVLAMTLPVVWERQAPAAAAAVVAAGALLNEVLVGPMVRCGPCLPAVLAIGFFAGTRLDGRKLAAAIVFCLGAVTAQAFFDPKLGPGFLAFGVPATAGLCLAGRLMRSRTAAAAALRARNAELREQREQTARLAVAADRARVTADLEEFLGDRITTMAQTAASGRDLITTHEASARGAFSSIENDGRAILSRMREVVGTLREDALTEPQPVLAQLGSLLERATSADVRLRVEGSPRALPAGVELSGYRIVEHLLAALQDAPDARVDVRLRFGPDALEMRVTGPPTRPADPAPVSAAREWAALIGGTLRMETGSSRCDAFVRLPLTAGYASS